MDKWTTLRRTLYKIQVPKEKQLLRILYNAIQPPSLRKRVRLRMWSGCGPPKLDTNVEEWRERARKSVRCLKRLIRENADYMDTKGKVPEQVTAATAQPAEDMHTPPNLDSESEGDALFGRALAPVERAENEDAVEAPPPNICAHPTCNERTSKKYHGKGYFKMCIKHAQLQQTNPPTRTSPSE